MNDDNERKLGLGYSWLSGLTLHRHCSAKAFGSLVEKFGIINGGSKGGGRSVVHVNSVAAVAAGFDGTFHYDLGTTSASNGIAAGIKSVLVATSFEVFPV